MPEPMASNSVVKDGNAAASGRSGGAGEGGGGDARLRGIDLELTGRLLRLRLRRAGIPVRKLQLALGLDFPQSIYRWFKGQALPSVDHLYAMHRILDMPMEDILVTVDRPQRLRCAAYFTRLVS